jgi:hypothetical protein
MAAVNLVGSPAHIQPSEATIRIDIIVALIIFFLTGHSRARLFKIVPFAVKS